MKLTVDERIVKSSRKSHTQDATNTKTPTINHITHMKPHIHTTSHANMRAHTLSHA